MAEPISLASGILTLATFACNSSIELYRTIQSFQSRTKTVRDLLEELEALNGVLNPLIEKVNANTNVDLSTLDLPLLRCGNACKEFEQVIQKCSSQAGGRTGFRDWARLTYMRDDIDGFRRLLAGYKLTITIALTDANLRQSSLTADSVESYQELIKTATDDLQSHLEGIDEKLDIIFKQAATHSSSDAAEIRLIEEERLSTQRCLKICDQLSEHINQIKITPERNASSPVPMEPDSIPERVTNEGLQECKSSLTLTATRLERHMKDLMDRLVSKTKITMTSTDEAADLARLQEEWETARQCIDICSKAENHLKDNVSIIENYATGDAVQFMVSTNGKIIHGKNRGLGWRTRQVGGHLSDASVVHLSRDMSRTNFQNTGNDDSSRSNTLSVPEDIVESGPVSGFSQRYGRGNRLASKSTLEVTTSSTRPAESGEVSSPKN